MKTIYLSGPIGGCSDEEVNGWRRRFKMELEGKYDFIDPTRLEFHGANAKDIVRQDILDIVSCDIFVANIFKVTPGTMQEIGIARILGKDIRLIVSDDTLRNRPWISTLPCWCEESSLISNLDWVADMGGF